MGDFTYMLDSDNEVVKQAEVLLTTSSGSANATVLPNTNATMLPVSLPWRSGPNGTHYIELDMGSAVDVDFVAVAGHNLSVATTFQMVGGDTANPSSVTFDLLPNMLVGARTSYAIRAAGSVNHRYWRLKLDGPANPDGFYEIGYIVLGVKKVLGFNMLPDWQEDLILTNRASETQGGAPLVGELVDSRSRFTVTFSDMLKAERDLLKVFLRSLNGGNSPLFVVPDPDDNFGIFGRLETPTEIPMIHRNKGVIQDAAVTFIEDNPGIRINV